MLVLSRRENEQIDFPALGISVTVLSSSRSRASLGIRAPSGVRIMRHEIACEVDIASDSGPLVEIAKQQIARHLYDQLDDQMQATTKRLELAQQQLAEGKSQVAMRELTAALADLDAVRASLKSNQRAGDSAGISFETDENWATADKISAAKVSVGKSQEVSESGSAYVVCIKGEGDDTPDQRRNVSRSSEFHDVDWCIESDPRLALRLATA